jgi:hypothetical protein
MGLDFIRDGFLRVGLARKALFLATGGLSGFVLKDNPKPRTAKTTAKPASSAKPAKARRAKARKAARPKATKPIQKRTRPQQAKATRAKAAKKTATRTRATRRPAKAPAPVRLAAQAEAPAGGGSIHIQRITEAQPIGAASAARPGAAHSVPPAVSQPLGRPDPATGDEPWRDTPVRDPETYNAVDASAQAARRLAELASDRDQAPSGVAVNGGNDADG